MTVKSKNLKYISKYKPMTWVALSETSNKVVATAKSLKTLSEKIKNYSKNITVMMIPPKENFAPIVWQ